MREDTWFQFQTTRWTLLEAMGLGGETGERARTQVADMYWPSVYAYLRRSGRPREEAREITQGFFSDVVYGRELLRAPDRSKGQLRGRVLKALRNYIIDLHRRTNARVDQFVLASEWIEASEADLTGNPALSADILFEQMWARASLTEAMRRCEAHFRTIGKDGHWRAFEIRVLRPTIHAAVVVPYEDLFESCGFRTAGDARAAVQTVKRWLVGFLEEVAAENGDGGRLATTAALIATT